MERAIQPKNFKRTIVKQVIFISVESNEEYLQKKQELLATASDYFDFLPPTSIISQVPENGSLALELTTIENPESWGISYRKNETASWLVLKRCDVKMIFACGFGEAHENANFLDESNSAFRSLESVLKEEELNFSDIIRQWNYIEQITKNVNCNNSLSQHYQIFNDVRSKYYQKANFVNGFPAATGIGQDFGGIIIDIIAFKSDSKISIIPIKSPVQLDAYSYTKEVLAENNSMSDFCRTSPKFERAKLLTINNCNCVFVSGTAAIKGQASIPEVSVEVQTEMTIRNILSLISQENIKNHGVESNENVKLKFLRVYVKYANDISAVRIVCQNYFPQISAIYLVADICRPELLVEIEGFAILK